MATSSVVSGSPGSLAWSMGNLLWAKWASSESDLTGEPQPFLCILLFVTITFWKICIVYLIFVQRVVQLGVAPKFTLV